MGAKKHKKVRKEVRAIYTTAAEKQVESDVGAALKAAHREIKFLNARMWLYRVAVVVLALGLGWMVYVYKFKGA
jgi:hypothetical protein